MTREIKAAYSGDLPWSAKLTIAEIVRLYGVSKDMASRAIASEPVPDAQADSERAIAWLPDSWSDPLSDHRHNGASRGPRRRVPRLGGRGST